MALLCGHAGRLTSTNGGFRPGQLPPETFSMDFHDSVGLKGVTHHTMAAGDVRPLIPCSLARGLASVACCGLPRVPKRRPEIHRAGPESGSALRLL
jgi:hypothetical protein